MPVSEIGALALKTGNWELEGVCSVSVAAATDEAATYQAQLE